MQLAHASYCQYFSLTGRYDEEHAQDLRNPAAQGNDPWSRKKREEDARVWQNQLQQQNRLVIQANTDLMTAYNYLVWGNRCVGIGTGAPPIPMPTKPIPITPTQAQKPPQQKTPAAPVSRRRPQQYPDEGAVPREYSSSHKWDTGLCAAGIRAIHAEHSSKIFSGVS